MSNSTGDFTALRVTTQPDGIAIVTLDVPGESVNTLYPELSDELEKALTHLETDPTVKGVVITSGKKDGFIAGAKIEMIAGVTSADQAAELSRQGQQGLNRLEKATKPVVAAIHGACLGGGLELALACHWRVATDDRKTKLGLPEVQLGLIPGAGGTQRLPRLIGVADALDLILTGKQLKAARAKKAGVVDEVVPKTSLLEIAARRAREIAEGSLVPETARAPRPHGARELQDRVKHLLLDENPVGRQVVFRKAREKTLEKSRGHYPALERAIDVTREGFERGFEAGLEAEAKAFGELAVTDVSRRLVELFFAITALKKDNGVDDPSVQPLPVRKIGVLGAGLMGSGVAYVSTALADVHVRLRDRDDASVARGLSSIAHLYAGRVKKRRLSKYERDRKMGLVSGTTDYTGFHNVDLVVEAVFEDLALKHQVIKEAEAVLPAHAIYASNTSSLPIAKIAEASARPERVVGMHYFSPVDKMPLLEVITHPGTLPEVTATAVAVGKKQGKTVIVVRDGVGFYTSRILAPYMNEAAWALSEGARIEDLDEALLNWGFPVGPTTLLDEVGIDVGANVGRVMEEAFGERMKSPGSLDGFLADGRLGRKAKKGLYLYDEEGKTKQEDGRKLVDETAYDLMPGGRKRRSFPLEALAERLALRMVNEAVFVFADGGLRSARDGDVGAIFGLGFPPFRGGPFRYVDSVGAASVVARLQALEQQHGPRFRPAPLLEEMAREGRRFHAD